MTTKIEADYLIVGAGAMGMAFADTLIAETDATIVMVDRYHQPGGHWTMAYPFVRLHQPSTGYGVNSRALGSDAIDRSGWNAGLYELASAGEVCAYFDQVMQQTLLPTGRVGYHPMCEHEGGDRFRSSVTGETFSVNVRRRIVDSTYQHVTVPAMRPPGYHVAPGVACVAPNGLAALRAGFDHYTVIGAGKTGIDACLWLLRQGVHPDSITWVMPRDSWLVDRAYCQPGPLFAQSVGEALSGQARAILESQSLADLFNRLEDCDAFLRLDRRVRPTMYRCATVSRAELEQLRRIKDVVRLGRVQRIEESVIILDGGSVPTGAATLHVDCSADGLEKRPSTAVFDGRKITLQSVRTCQQVFSAAFIAHVEAAYDDDATRNALCVPIPHPDSDMDWVHTMIANARNELRWAEDEPLQMWLEQSRLNWVGRLGPLLPSEPEHRAHAVQMKRKVGEALSDKLVALLAAGT